MIGPVVAAVRDLVVTPQTTPDTPTDRRVHLDPVVGAAPQSVEVLAVASTLASVEIGGGVTFRHDVDVVVTVEHGDTARAYELRDGIVADLAVRAVTADWANADYGGQEFGGVVNVGSIRYAEGTTDDPDTLAAYAVLTFTVETTVRP